MFLSGTEWFNNTIDFGNHNPIFCKQSDTCSKKQVENSVFPPSIQYINIYFGSHVGKVLSDH
jgi:hypothetical protein